MIAAGLLAAIPSAWAGANEPPPPASQTIALAINDRGHMTVAIQIAGQGPFAFIVDTAATRTVISQQLAASLQLQPAGRVSMLSLTGSSDEMMVHVPALMFSPGRSQDIRALALNEASLGSHGILGIDALKDQRVVMDFKAHTLTVSASPRRPAHEAEPDEIIVTARRKLGQLILGDSTIDGERIDLIVDTGTQVSLGNEALRRLLLKDGSRYKMTQIAIVGVTGGVLNADYTRVDQLRIGRAQLIGMPIAFADAYPFRKLKLRRPALLLGMDALQMFARVTVDFPNRRATFLMPDQPS